MSPLWLACQHEDGKACACQEPHRHLDAGVLLLEEFPGAGNGAAGAHARHKDVHLPACLRPVPGKRDAESDM